MPNPDLIATAEAARILRVAPATLNRWAAEGVIEPVVQGNGRTGARFYERAHVVALHQRRRAAALARFDEPAELEPQPA